MKLSIIIPVYNVEEYVVQCISSCINQEVPLGTYEIIIVNDGSTDGSLTNAEAIVTGNPIVRIFSQENKGLSAARNKGMSLAKGEYIWFVDSDDWIDCNCLGIVLEYLHGEDVIAMTDYYKEGSWIDLSSPCVSTKAQTGKELLRESYIIPSQFYIYKREFLIRNKLSFFPGIYHEDLEFTPRMLYLCNSLAVIPHKVYHFRKRAGSITQTPLPKKTFDLFVIMYRIKLFMEGHVAKDDKKLFYFIFNSSVNAILKESLLLTPEDRLKISGLFFQNKYIFSYMTRMKPLKYKMEGCLFSLFPRAVLRTYDLLKKVF